MTLETASIVTEVHEASVPPHNRTRLQILADILDIAQRDMSKTHIMYKANLSHKQLGKYLGFLEANGLIEGIFDPAGKLQMRVTEKGMNFLREYERLEIYFNGKKSSP